MTRTLSWGVAPPDQVKQGLVIEPAPTVELRTGPDQVLDLGEGQATIRREDGGPLGGTLSQPLVGGIATFDDLTIPDPGPRKLIAEVDTSSLVYPGMSSDGAVLFFRFNQPPGKSEVGAEVGDVVLSLISDVELTGQSLKKTTPWNGSWGVDVSDVPGLKEAVGLGGEAVVRLLYRRPDISGTAEVRISGPFAPCVFIFRIDGRAPGDQRVRCWNHGTANTPVRCQGEVGPIGEMHLASFHWRWDAVTNQLNSRLYLNGHLVDESSRSSPSEVDANNLQPFFGQGSEFLEIFELGIFSGPTTPEKEMTEALRCGVVR